MKKTDFFLYGPDRPVTPAGPLWQNPLPLSRDATIKGRGDDTDQPTLGTYFEAVTAFLTLENGRALAQAVNAQTGVSCHPEEIEEIAVTLEKHGAFYHPASVRVKTPGGTCLFVVNVAVSPEGRKIIDREFQLLQQLDPSTTGQKRLIPAGYYQAESGPQQWPLYLGQWFEGFHEFHLTPPKEDDPEPIIVWAPEPFYLTRASQKEALCHQIARVLTHFYNPLTFEQIGPWHHAAGDFIILTSSDIPDVKLITIRDYRPSAIAPSEATPATILEGLLFFFLHLSLQIRLDRLDGTGRLVWAGNWSVQGMVNGFFEALLEKPEMEPIPLPLSTAFGFYLARQTPDQLKQALETVVTLYSQNSAEHHLIRDNLSSHLGMLLESLAPMTALFQTHLD